MMSFSIHLASDEQLDTLLHSNKRIPSWRLANTQSERERKRIHQLQLHNQQLKRAKEDELQRKKRQLNETSQVSVSPNKKSSPNQGDDLEL